MAIYTDPETLIRDFWQIPATQMPQEIIERAAIMAYNKINSCLAGIYTVPFSTTPPEIKDISDLLTKSLAMMFHLKRGGPKIDPSKKTSQKFGEAELALEWLKNIVAGQCGITGETRLTTRGPSFRPDYVRIFDVDSVFNHLPDENLLDAIDNERDT